MKAAVVPAMSSSWQIKDVPQPQPGPGQVLVKMRASGICYTDVHETLGHIPGPFPRILGHEPVGEIVAVAPDVTTRKVGDHLLWGTDSVWWGSPQWQIEAFRRLEMSAELTERFGWKPLTADVKRKVFGLNAARDYGVDPPAKRNPMPPGYVEKLRNWYKQSAAPTPNHTQYGWVRADFLAASGV